MLLLIFQYGVVVESAELGNDLEGVRCLQFVMMLVGVGFEADSVSAIVMMLVWVPGVVLQELELLLRWVLLVPVGRGKGGRLVLDDGLRG